MRAGMSYFHETIWKGVPKFLRRIDTALKNIGINERLPYNAPLIQFSSWMGGDRDGIFSYPNLYIHFCLERKTELGWDLSHAHMCYWQKIGLFVLLVTSWY